MLKSVLCDERNFYLFKKSPGSLFDISRRRKVAFDETKRTGLGLKR
ncbi:MAG: hypothetical protein RBR14_03595 [Candidatus Cloacimonas acidaminovorans]|jgi:hypothetical protein|nr:hypothetical protein [Candidatus Cloacimonas acidaminovorans]